MTGSPAPRPAAEADWLRTAYGAVFAALRQSLDSPLAAVVPGTGGTVDAALAFFRHVGDAPAVARLEAIALIVHELQLALRSVSHEAISRRRAELSALTKDWLAAAPMFPVPAARGERRAA